MPFKALLLSALSGSSLLFCSCVATSPQQRITQNQDLFNSLPAKDKTLVQRGDIKKGMNKKAVYLAWGAPSNSSKGSTNGKSYERWYYKSYQPSYSGGFYSGYGHHGYGHHGFSIGTSNHYNSELLAKVEFRKGRVFSWEDGK